MLQLSVDEPGRGCLPEVTHGKRGCHLRVTKGCKNGLNCRGNRRFRPGTVVAIRGSMKLFSSRHAAASSRLHRRTFLKALGLGLSSPLAAKMAGLAIAAVPTRPTRALIFYLPHGMPIEHWDVGDDLDLSRSGVGIFSPLSPYNQYLSVLRGVGINTATNHAAIRSTLTGDEASNSIDYEIANRLGSTAHVLGAHANPAGAGSDAQLVKHGGWVDPISNPADALDDLFSGLEQPATEPGDVDLSAQFRQQALALTEGELEAMQSELMGLTTEQNKLMVHLESLRAYKATTESGGGLATISCDARPALPTAQAMAGRDAYLVENLADVVDGHLEAAAQAFVCGSARMITMQNLHANGQINMGFSRGPGIAKNHHDPLSHSGNGQDQGREEFALVQKWFIERLATKFLSALLVDDPADPGHTVLDNTTVLILSEIVDGANHTSAYNAQTWDVPGGPRETYLPCVMIGRGGGTLAGGRSVYVPGMDHRNVLCTLGHTMGVSLAQFGGTSVSPVSEVLA